MPPDPPGQTASASTGAGSTASGPTASGRTARRAGPGRSLARAAVTLWGVATCLGTVALPVEATETVVPLDVSGRLLKLNAEQRAAIGLWPGLYPHFQEARLLADSTGVELIQILWRDGAVLRQQRVQLNAA